jgi:hypothetical protein
MYGCTSSAGVVAQAREAEVGTQAVEQPQRARVLQLGRPHAVRHLVADQGELGGGEPAREFRSLRAVQLQVVGAIEHVAIGDLLLRRRDGDLHAVVVAQEAELLLKVGAEEARAGDGHRIGPRPRQPCIGARETRPRALRRVGDAQLGIGEGAVEARLGVGAVAGAQVGGERRAQPRGRGGVERLQLVQQGGKVGSGRHAEP